MSGQSALPGHGDGLEDLPVLHRLEDVVELQEAVGRVYLRYSRGPATDAGSTSRDKESGCVLPGLSTNPITPEPWWTRPVTEWVARQLCQYDHLGRRDGNHGWLLTGTEVGRGPDCEPLLVDVTALAVIDEDCLAQAEALYRSAFEPGRV